MSHTERSDLRQSIVETAIELGRELGEDGLTMRAIASRLGLSPTALYHHFESKAQIVDEIRLYGLRTLATECVRGFQTGDPRESLIEGSRRYVAFGRRNPWLYGVLMHSDVDPRRLLGSDAIPEEREINRRVQEAVVERYGAIVGKDQDSLSYFLARWWTGNHGLTSLVVGGRLVPDHPILPIYDLDRFIEISLAALADSLLLPLENRRQA